VARVADFNIKAFDDFIKRRNGLLTTNTEIKKFLISDYSIRAIQKWAIRFKIEEGKWSVNDLKKLRDWMYDRANRERKEYYEPVGKIDFITIQDIVNEITKRNKDGHIYSLLKMIQKYCLENEKYFGKERRRYKITKEQKIEIIKIFKPKYLNPRIAFPKY